MTMPMSEQSPHVLTERSASFNRAEFSKSMQTKASMADSITDVEFTENLTITIKHIRHSSLDSLRPSALHSINLNAKFDQLLSPLCPVKPSPHNFVEQMDKGSSCWAVSEKPKEGGTETQEELILDPHESLLQDSQEESFSLSMSAESKSPREDGNFILWGNAVFCLSPMRNKGRKTGGFSGEGVSKPSHLSNGKHHSHLLTADEITLSPASDRSLLPLDTLDDDLLSFATNLTSSSNLNKVPGVKQAESFTCQSIQESSTQKHVQARKWVESSTQRDLLSPEAQSWSLDFDAEDMETSAASDGKMPHDRPQESEDLSKQSSQEGNSEEMDVDVCSQQASHKCGVLSSQLNGEVEQDLAIASEEVKIRAELELEIERDLEEEIKTKIFLLSRRLEELQVLKSTRRPMQEDGGLGSCIPGTEKEKADILTKGTSEAPPLKSLPSISPKDSATTLGCRIGSQAETVGQVNSASCNKQLPTVQQDMLAAHDNNPFASLRKFVMASGWAPHTKESNVQLPPSAGGEVRTTKVLKISIEELPPAKSKFQVDNTPNFNKQDCPDWILSTNTNAKKLDWIRTLRSEVPCTPRLSSMKAMGEHYFPFLPPKEPLVGHVARNLFSEVGLLTPPRKTLSKVEKRESLTTPQAGGLRRYQVSSSKLNNDLVASTPCVQTASSGPLTHENAIKSAPTKRDTSQKPGPGIQPSPVPKVPDVKQKARNATPSVLRSPPSSRHGKTEKISILEPLTSPTRSLKTSSTHSEKVKRSASAPPSAPSRGVSSKDTKAASMKALQHKPVSSLPQTRASRTASLSKPATSSLVPSKGRSGAPSDIVGKRPGTTPSRPVGTKGKWY